MMVPFLFSVAPATPPAGVVTPVVVVGAPTATMPAPDVFAGLLAQMVDGALPPTHDPVRDDNPALDDQATTPAVEWIAALMMPVPTPPPAMAAEASPMVDAAPGSTPAMPATVEQAIAAAATLLGVDAADITVESLITESAPEVSPPTSAVTAQLGVVSDTETVRSDLSLLEPRFRARVERVIARARTELGLQVEVRETLRSQDRQDALYAQGRTQPGEVVTWTKRSLHTSGFAADLEILVDPTATRPTPDSYARLASIAHQEGLATLGPRDPGHVEFRGGFPLPQAAIPRRVDASLKPLGKVAPVARPATVVAPQSATPAPVASVAIPRLVTTPTTEHESPSEPTHEEDDAVASSEGSAGFMQSGSREAGNDFSLPGAERLGTAPTRMLTVAATSVSEPTILASNIASRVEQVHSIADIVAERPVSGVVLRLDGDAGQGDRIRIDVRRNVVETSVHTADPALTHRLVSESPALHSALERHGLEVGRIEVRSPGAVIADAQSRAFENNRDRESSAESYRRHPQQEPRQRQRRHHNQNGESQR